MRSPNASDKVPKLSLLEEDRISTADFPSAFSHASSDAGSDINGDVPGEEHDRPNVGADARACTFGEVAGYSHEPEQKRLRLVRVFQKAVRSTIAQKKRHRQGEGVTLALVASRAKRRFMTTYQELDDAHEKDFLQEIYTSLPVMLKETVWLRQIRDAVAVSYNEGKHRWAGANGVISEAAKALHHLKNLTARLCWSSHVYPLRTENAMLKDHYASLKEQFNRVRTEYLHEVTALREQIGKRCDPDDDLEGSDIKMFYDPLHCLSDEEFSFCAKVVKEKLRMIFTHNTALAGKLSSAQIESMEKRMQHMAVEDLQKALTRLIKENAQLKEQIQSLTDMNEAQPLQIQMKADAMIKMLEERCADLNKQLAERSQGDAIKHLKDELEHLQKAYDDELEERISVQKKLATTEKAVEAAKAGKREAEQSLAVAELTNTELRITIESMNEQIKGLRKQLQNSKRLNASRQSFTMQRQKSIRDEDPTDDANEESWSSEKAAERIDGLLTINSLSVSKTSDSRPNSSGRGAYTRDVEVQCGDFDIQRECADDVEADCTDACAHPSLLVSADPRTHDVDSRVQDAEARVQELLYQRSVLVKKGGESEELRRKECEDLRRMYGKECNDLRRKCATLEERRRTECQELQDKCAALEAEMKNVRVSRNEELLRDVLQESAHFMEMANAMNTFGRSITEGGDYPEVPLPSEITAKKAELSGMREKAKQFHEGLGNFIQGIDSQDPEQMKKLDDLRKSARRQECDIFLAEVALDAILEANASSNAWAKEEWEASSRALLQKVVLHSQVLNEKLEQTALVSFHMTEAINSLQRRASDVVQTLKHVRLDPEVKSKLDDLERAATATVVDDVHRSDSGGREEEVNEVLKRLSSRITSWRTEQRRQQHEHQTCKKWAPLVKFAGQDKTQERSTHHLHPAMARGNSFDQASDGEVEARITPPPVMSRGSARPPSGHSFASYPGIARPPSGHSNAPCDEPIACLEPTVNFLSSNRRKGRSQSPVPIVPPSTAKSARGIKISNIRGRLMDRRCSAPEKALKLCIGQGQSGTDSHRPGRK